VEDVESAEIQEFMQNLRGRHGRSTGWHGQRRRILPGSL
jgi:hypothetical protein